MQYRIQFLEGEASVIRELSADARSAINALLLVGDLDWPPRAVTTRVLDAEGREVYSEVQGDRFKGNGAYALKWPRRSCSIIWRA